MTRLIPGCTLVGLMLTLLPAPTSAAGSNTATTLFPVDEVTQLETHTFLDCHPNGSCDFVAGANLRTPDGPTGFPPGLWARQTTEIRSTNRLAYLDAHATSQFERVMKAGGSDVITTVYFGEGPPDKYQTTGVIDSTNWSTGQPMTDVNVIVCTPCRWSTRGSTSPRPAPARKPTFPS